ncbi:hypothetical protein [Spirosoma gilvum]
MAKKSTSADPKPTTSLGKLAQLVREKWPEYVIEIIVIIFSISISFALDEWKDDRHKQELEQTYLKGLYSDIQTDMRQIGEVIAETKQVIQKATSLSNRNPQTPISDYEAFVQDFRFVFRRPRFIAEDVTFADLKSTGNMQVISNALLKRALFDYYKQYETIVRVETAELETTNTIIGPYLLRRLPLTGTSLKNAGVNWGAALAENEYQNALLVRRSTREELLRDYQESLRLGRSILTLIKPAIK